MSEGKIIEGFGDIEESLDGFRSFFSVQDNQSFIGSDKSINFFLSGENNGRWLGLFFDPLDNSVFGSSSLIVRGFSVNEPFKSGESLDSKSRS